MFSADENQDPAVEMSEKILEKADVIQVKGAAITTLTEIQCLTPRGRYDLKIYPSFLHLHGRTFDFKLTYTSIIRLFLLPHKDHRQVFFVISVDPPIKQGNYFLNYIRNQSLTYFKRTGKLAWLSV
jgi:structure-specific recognition protein 1